MIALRPLIAIIALLTGVAAGLVEGLTAPTTPTGLAYLTMPFARAYARENVLAFAICPGFTMTGMAGDYLESRGGDKLLADIPLGRVADRKRTRLNSSH